MIKAHTVIGANYGDEGKGLTTDWLASQRPSLVIRFNGGAQAGHTVTTPEGQRHVFGHFGSGSFVGFSRDTYLSKYFIVNPILFLKEYAKLKALGVRPRTFIDNACRVTTPYDVMINQFVEMRRGDRRHGSCGAGINETVTRHNDIPLRVSHLSRPTDLKAILTHIRQHYVPARMNELGIKSLTAEEKEVLWSDNIFNRFLEDCDEVLEKSHRVYGGIGTLKNRALGLHYAQYIFEGAQGLRLDEHHRNFPYVTRSKTGLMNALVLAAEAGIRKMDVHYITRSYLTRHGAGPLDTLGGELQGKPFPAIEDKTNIPNQFQGTLRFAYLDLDDLSKEINKDFQQYYHGVTVTKKTMVSCLDQLPLGEATYYLDGLKHITDTKTFLNHIKNKVNASELTFSVGPTRDYIQEF